MHRIVVLTFVIILGLIVGCSSNGPKVAKSDASVMEVLPPAPAALPPAEPQFASAPINDQPAFAAPAAQPVSYATPVAPIASPAAKSYTVKKGDTLYSIAKTQLGSGKEWQKIVSANPGLTPAKLKVGQQIAMP